MKDLKQIIKRFALPEGLESEEIDIKPLGNGLINTTYLVTVPGHQYVLQSINTSIFPDVEGLQGNIKNVTDHLREKLNEQGVDDIERKVMRFIPLADDENVTYVRDDEGKTWRMSVFISGSETREEVNADSAYEAGKAFGKFQKDLSDIKAPLTETIPGFHDMILRLDQLHDAVEKDPVKRAEGVKDMLDKIEALADEMTLSERMKREGKIPVRVCHCDTKVNNMLYDAETGNVLCVIDLDTVMPSMIFSDYGDFLRTGACSTPEDEPETDKIQFRMDVFEQFTKGYLSEAKDFLTSAEIDRLPNAVALFPYMQAVRFLTDWINGDTYYKIKYPEHNLVRTRAQLAFLDKVLEAMPEIEKTVKACV